VIEGLKLLLLNYWYQCSERQLGIDSNLIFRT